MQFDAYKLMLTDLEASQTQVLTCQSGSCSLWPGIWAYILMRGLQSRARRFGKSVNCVKYTPLQRSEMHIVCSGIQTIRNPGYGFQNSKESLLKQAEFQGLDFLSKHFLFL